MDATDKQSVYNSYILIYMQIYKQDLALNNQQGLICHKTQLTSLVGYLIPNPVYWEYCVNMNKLLQKTVSSKQIFLLV